MLNDYVLWKLANEQQIEALRTAQIQPMQRASQSQNFFLILLFGLALHALDRLLILTPSTLKWSSDL